MNLKIKKRTKLIVEIDVRSMKKNLVFDLKREMIFHQHLVQKLKNDRGKIIKNVLRKHFNVTVVN